MGATSWNFELFLKQAAHGNWGSYLEQYADQVLADQNALATADAKLKSDEANEPNNLSLIQADAAAVEHDLGKTHDDELSMVNALINNECAIMESMGGGAAWTQSWRSGVLSEALWLRNYMQANPDSTFAGFANEGINFGGPLAALQNLAIAPQVQDPVAADLDQAQLLENEQKVFGNTQTILCNLNPLAYCTLVMLFAGEQAQDQVTDEANNQEFLNNVAANIRQEMDNARSYLATNAKNMGSGFVTSMNADGTTIPIYTGSTTTKYGDYGPSSTITDPNALNTYIQNLGDTLNSVTGMSSTNQIYLQSGASNVSQAFGMASSILKTMDSIYESIINHFPS